MIKTNLLETNALTTSASERTRILSEKVRNDVFLELPDLTASKPMIEKEIAPPIHVWDRIAKVLDEQDKMKKSDTNPQPFSHSFKTKITRKYVFASVGVSVFAGVMWYLS